MALRLFPSIALSALLIAGCGATGNDGEGDLPPGGGGIAVGAGGEGAAPAAGGSPGSGGLGAPNPMSPPLIVDGDPPVATGGAGPTETCGGNSFKAEPKTLEMYILFDDSGSWGNQPWQTATDAVNGFISDAASDGIGVALSYFGSVCSVDPFLTPQVEMATLPANRAELQAAIMSHEMRGETVTQPALAGGIQYARTRLESGVNSRIVMLLVTDGDPDTSDCRDVPEMPNDIPAVAMTAATGLEGDVQIPTYVLAVAGGEELTERLNTIAAAGGTEQAINASPADLAAAFAGIRAQELASLPCEYDLPAEYAEINDPDKVNLTISAAPLGRVGAEAECAAAMGGWYYDDVAAPTRIIACGATCETLRAAPQGTTVDIALGCPTVVFEPPK